jgi:hypothetical protein
MEALEWSVSEHPFASSFMIPLLLTHPHCRCAELFSEKKNFHPSSSPYLRCRITQLGRSTCDPVPTMQIVTLRFYQAVSMRVN